MRAISIALLCLCSVVLDVSAQSNVETRIIASDLGNLSELVWGPDGWIWFVEVIGDISRVHPETGELQRFSTVAELDSLELRRLLGTSERSKLYDNGLQSLALCEKDGQLLVYHLFLYHVGPSRRAFNAKIVRYEFDGTALVKPEIILEGLPADVDFPIGCRMRVIGNKLFVGYGNLANDGDARNPESPVGSILRMNLDGSVPSDNPFPSAQYPGNLVWTYGCQKLEGLAAGPDGVIYSLEGGPSGFEDEINIVEGGRNYGWPDVRGFCDSPQEQLFCLGHSVVEPLYYLPFVVGVSGLDYYGGDRFPAWKNSLLVTSSEEQDLRQLKLGQDGRTIVDENIYIDGRWGPLRDVCVSPDGRVFLATKGGVPSNFPNVIMELYDREEPLPSIGRIEFEDDLYCGGSTGRIRFDTEGGFEQDNLFLIALVSLGDSTEIRYVGDALPGTSGGEYLANFPWFYDSVYLRVVSTNPYVMGEVSGPLKVSSSTRDVRLQTSTGEMAICEDETLEIGVQGVAPDTRYLWSNGSRDSIINVSDSGLYAVELTLPNGCTVRKEVRITKGSSPYLEVVNSQRNYDLCEGDSLLLSVLTSENAFIMWSNGIVDTNAVWVRESGVYYVRAEDSVGCQTSSLSMEIVFHEYPEKPEIVRGGNTLVCSSADQYQWYRDGEPVDGGTEQLLTVTDNGRYWVEVFNSGGCSAVSDTVEMIVTGVGEEAVAGDDWQVYPQPVEDQMMLEFAAPVREPLVVSLTDMSGREVRRFRESPDGTKQKMFSLSDLPSGPYILGVKSGTWTREQVIIKR